jgi:cell division protein FtsZ
MGDELRVTVIATRFEEIPENIKGQESLLHPKVAQTVSKAEEKAGSLLPVAETEEEDDAEFKESILSAREMIQAKRQELKNRLNQNDREERLSKLNSKAYDIHDPESLNGLEAVPAYIRRKIALEEFKRDAEKARLSRLSIEEDKENKIRLKENNSFLHDKPD